MAEGGERMKRRGRMERKKSLTKRSGMVLMKWLGFVVLPVASVQRSAGRNGYGMSFGDRQTRAKHLKENFVNQP